MAPLKISAITFLTVVFLCASPILGQEVPTGGDLRKAALAAFSFAGQVVQVSGSNMAGVPPRSDTFVVRVDQYVGTPTTVFLPLKGRIVTVRMQGPTAPPALGVSAYFYTDGWIYGDHIALQGSLWTCRGKIGLAELATHLAEARVQAHNDDIKDRIRLAHKTVIVGTVQEVARLKHDHDRTDDEHAPDLWVATIGEEASQIGRAHV